MRRVAVGMLVAGLACAGCGGGGGTSSPSPVATSTIQVPGVNGSGAATPTPGGVGTPSPSGSAAPSSDPLYLEAVGVYQKFLEETWKLDVAGGAKDLPPEVNELAVDPLRTATRVLYQQMLPKGERMSPPNPTTTYAPLKTHRDGSLIDIQVCIDSTSSSILDRAGHRLGSGNIVQSEISFKRAQGKLVAFDSQDREVPKCKFVG